MHFHSISNSFHLKHLKIVLVLKSLCSNYVSSAKFFSHYFHFSIDENNGRLVLKPQNQGGISFLLCILCCIAYLWCVYRLVPGIRVLFWQVSLKVYFKYCLVFANIFDMKYSGKLEPDTWWSISTLVLVFLPWVFTILMSSRSEKSNLTSRFTAEVCDNCLSFDL